MATSSIGLIWLTFLTVILIGTIVWSVKAKLYASLSRRGVVAAIAPGVIMIVGFYALAVHMYAALGGWPKSIGNDGFLPALVRHADWTWVYFFAMVLVSIFVWPVAVGICSAVPRLRRFVAYLSLFAVSTIVCYIGMLLGPAQFLYWWWD